MRRLTLDLLCCPRCHGEVSAQGEQGGEAIDSGSLYCSSCKASFPIDNGIPQFIDLEEVEGLNLRFARFYNWFSRLYPLVTKIGMLGFGGDRRARNEVLDRLELGGGRVLEVSIGTGANLPYLFERPDLGKIYGLDISSLQLARCQEFVAKRDWPVDLFLGTAEALPFKSEAFDSVFHIGGINFFSNKRKAIEEMVRVARPGSRIVIADESEEVARSISRILRVRHPQGGALDLKVPVALVPDAMEEVRVDGIWKAHGHHHGYCLEFRKPA
jgi:ubiquinone/menaquinone biosynthesis C-methylase UbiE/uncharacterized protein YbaR (Trm112 family)